TFLLLGAESGSSSSSSSSSSARSRPAATSAGLEPPLSGHRRGSSVTPSVSSTRGPRDYKTGEDGGGDGAVPLTNKKKKKKRKKSLKCCKERIGVASASGAPSCRCSASGSPASEAMGCGLRKLEDPEDSTPGKIYSTLKRPQVETKTETVYEYVLLDFSLEDWLL
uniref:Raftlin family member 2 n=1 Tax=Gasterosteus aculeatus aculeatus TaxID=481459 RepID=A0AAQ4R7D3_GASAC